MTIPYIFATQSGNVPASELDANFTAVNAGSSATTFMVQALTAAGVIAAPSFIGALTGNATTATNVAYTGLTGTVPTWNQNTTGTAALATSIASGLANQVVYQIAPGTTGFITAPTVVGGLLQWNGSSFVWAAGAAYTPSAVAITGGSITGTTITAADSAFTLLNATDNTKKVIFSASGVATGTTSTITIPGVSGTLAILNAVQTFTATQNINAALNTTGTTALATGTGGVTTIGSSAIASTTTIGGSAAGSTLSLNATTTATGNITAPVFVSNIATGTAPLVVTSTTAVANLSIGGTAALATSNSGGLANQIQYQTAPNTTGFITAPTVTSTYLVWNGSTFVWTLSSAYNPASVAITGGTIDGTAIGSTTASTAKFTTPATGDNSTNAATTAFVNSTVANLSGKNVLINGDMSISQINGGTAVTPAASGYAIDMWNLNVSQPSKLTFQQVLTSLNSLGAPVALKFTTASAYTSGPTDAFETHQLIEGSNFDRFFYGSANAKVASLQFKANASISGTYSGAILNAAGTRSYVFTFALAAGVDTPVFITGIPGDGVAGAGQWIGPSPQKAAELTFDLGSGSSFRSSTINAWQAGIYVGATGATSLVANAGATLAISEVQFELGPVCTAYERKLSSQSLAECQKYLQFESYATNTIISVAQVATSSSAYGAYKISVPMRVNPTATVSGTLQMNNAAGATAGGSIAMYAIGPNTLQINGSGATGLVAGNAAMIETYSAVTITFDARL